MFGIGLPEMIVILAVALIVVGPEKLPDLARSVAKWVFELKKTVNQVKNSLVDEDNPFDSVQKDIRRTGNELKEKFIESDHFTRLEPGGPQNTNEGENEVIDIAPGSVDSPGGDVKEPPDDAGEEQGPADPESGNKTEA